MAEERTRTSMVLLWIFVGAAAALLVLTAGRAAFQTPPRPEATNALGRLAAPDEVYDPVSAGEELPSGFRQLLGRDQILPVYDPQFVTAQDSEWPPDTLVIGVADAEAAKAYPVTFLNRREMVIDSLTGIPILVTW